MRYTDFVARLTGLAVTAAGATLLGRGLLVAPPGGVSRIGVVGPASVTLAVVGTGAIGAAFVIAGLAVLVGRGRALAVSVGGALTVAAVVGLAVGAGSPAGVLAVTAVSLALLFSGAATETHSTG
jgi:hypothetical protein